MIKGKWVIESVEGFTQKADENCPVCHRNLRYLNIVTEFDGIIIVIKNGNIENIIY